MNNDSLLNFAPYLFLLTSDETYYLNYWISVPEGYHAGTPTVKIDHETGTRITQIQIQESLGSSATIVKVEMETLTDIESVSKVSVVVEYPQAGSLEKKTSILHLSNADASPVVEPIQGDGILPYKPYGYLRKEVDTYRLYYLLNSPVNRDLHSPAEEPSEGDKFFLGYILDVPQTGDGRTYNGVTEVPVNNLKGVPYTYLDAYVATLEQSDSKIDHLGQPQTTGSLIILYEDAD